MAAAWDLKSYARKGVRVRIPLPLLEKEMTRGQKRKRALEIQKKKLVTSEENWPTYDQIARRTGLTYPQVSQLFYWRRCNDKQIRKWKDQMRDAGRTLVSMRF